MASPDLPSRPRIGDAFAAAVQRRKHKAPTRALGKSFQIATASTSSSSKNCMEAAVQVKAKPQEKLEFIKLAPEKQKPGVHVKTEVGTEIEAEVKIEMKSQTKDETKMPPAAKRRRPPEKRRNLAEEDRVSSTARGGSSAFDNTSFMPKIKRRITGKTAPPELADGTARTSDEPPPRSEYISVVNGTAVSEDPTGAKRRIHIAVRSAGVRNIAWEERSRHWRVSQRVPGEGRKFTNFSTAKWVAKGLAFEEAVSRALEEAKAFLAELRARGAIRDAGPAARSSGVRGVRWDSRRRRWRVEMVTKDAAGKQTRVEKSKNFRPADASEAAIEEARLKAVRCRQDMEARHQVFVRGGKPIPQRK